MRIFSFILVVVIASFLGSCTDYQYINIVNNPDVSDSGLVFENDSFRIEYSFNGEKLPVNITIFNKLTSPLYVDWSKSSAIINDQRISYFSENEQFKGYAVGVRVPSSIFSTEQVSSAISGTVYKNERISFIPPQSKVSYTSPTMLNAWLEPQGEKQKVEFQCVYGGVNGKRIVFTKDSSPFTFRSFITVSTDKNFEKEIYNDNEFWVNEVMETSARPNEILNYPASYTFNSRKTGALGVAGGTLFIGLVTLFFVYK